MSVLISVFINCKETYASVLTIQYLHSISCVDFGPDVLRGLLSSTRREKEREEKENKGNSDR